MKKIYYTQKQWNRLDDEIKENITKQYDVILTNHKTRRERLQEIIDVIDITMPRGRKKLNSGIDRFNGIMDDFSDAMDRLSKDMSQIGPKGDISEIMWGKKENTAEPDISEKLWGKKDKNYTI